jgi:hypothetical protein
MKAKILAACMLTMLAPAANAALEKWGPTWSEVTGNRWSKAQMNREPAIIKQVDGRHKTDRIVKVEPGKHEVVVQSPMRKGFQGSDVTLALDFEPCKRYYINAQFESGTGPDWKPVMAYVEKVPGCKLPDAATKDAAKK